MNLLLFFLGKLTKAANIKDRETKNPQKEASLNLNNSNTLKINIQTPKIKSKIFNKLDSSVSGDFNIISISRYLD